MSVFLSNLDDFIAPAQACVNPFVKEKVESSETQRGARITLEVDKSTSEFDMVASSNALRPDLIKAQHSHSSGGHKIAQVSLNDCLACSGCVTTAEVE
jgi:hypothetical protein